MERYKEGSNGTPYRGAYKTPEPEFDFKTPVFKTFDGLRKFSEMDENHPSVKFLLDRNLPKEAWNDIYFCPKFFEFTNRYVPNKFPSLGGDHPRMVIPFRTKEGNIFAYQGRAFGNEPQKYITIVLDKEHPKIFGYDRVDTSRSFYVVEGPIASLFIENCVAVAQSDLRLPQYKDTAVLIPDTAPGNRQVCKQIKKFIVNGYKVTLWPRTIIQKDINEMILSG